MPMTTIIASLIGTGAIVLVVAVAAVVGTYLFLRNNPRKKGDIDTVVDEIKKRL